MSGTAPDDTRPPPRKHRRAWNLRRRVAVLVVCLVALVAVTFGFVVLPEIRDRMRAEEEDKVELYASMVAAQMQDTLGAAVGQLEKVAASPAITGMEPAVLDDTLRQLDGTTPFFMFFMVLDDQGRVVSRPSKPERVGADRSDRPGFFVPWRTAATHVADVEVTTAGYDTVVAGTPIRRDGRLVGVLIGALGLMDGNQALYRPIVEPSQPSRPWPHELHLLSSSGHPLATSVGEADPPLPGAQNGWLIAERRIEPLGWTAMVRVPTSIIDDEIAAITRRFALVVALLLAAMLVIGLAAAEALVRPLSRLTAAMARYGREGVTDPVDVGGPGETHDALLAFNEMIREREHATIRREQLEDQLVQSQKLQTVGTLAGGIAHDFNNFLTPILLGGHRLASKLPAGDLRRELADGIVSSAEGARELVSRMLRFSRTTEGKREPEDISIVVEQALQLARVSIPRGVELTVAVDRDAGWARVDAVQIQQVILNLTGNAIGAIGDVPGRLSVAVRRSDDRRDVIIEVADTGAGMDEDALARIFEPFFTTKPPGEGTGLGLPVVKGIVDDHGGRIEIESAPGCGARFRICLPRLDTAEAVTSSGQRAPHRGRALVVDDDAPVARAAAFLLEELGFGAEIETDPTAAVDRAGDGFDLVLSDQSMPRQTGLELARAIRARHPELPILIMTGRPDDALEDGCRMLGLADPVAKPLVPVKLAAAIDAALSRASSPRPGPGGLPDSTIVS